MSRKREFRSESKWLNRVVAIDRVTKVVKGGKKNEFSSDCCRWRRKG